MRNLIVSIRETLSGLFCGEEEQVSTWCLEGSPHVLYHSYCEGVLLTQITHPSTPPCYCVQLRYQLSAEALWSITTVHLCLLSLFSSINLSRADSLNHCFQRSYSWWLLNITIAHFIVKVQVCPARSWACKPYKVLLSVDDRNSQNYEI